MRTLLLQLAIVLPIAFVMAPVRSADSAETGNASEIRIRGTINLKGERLELIDCDGEQRYRLRTEDPALTHALEQFAYASSLFADLAGTASTAGDSPSPVFTTIRINRMNVEGFACGDPGFSRLLYRASGNEPFWNVRAHPNRMTLTLIDGKTRDLPYVEERIRGAQRTLIAADTESRAELILVPEPCHDDMSGERMSLSATLRLNGDTQVFRGCAAPGALRNK